MHEWPFFADNKLLFANLSGTPCLPFAEPMLSNNSLWRFIHNLPRHTNLSRTTSSQKPLSGQGAADKAFFARLPKPLPPKCILTFAAHSHKQFAKLPLKKNLSANPNHQQGAHQTKSKHQGLWWLALAKPRFWKLGFCMWALSRDFRNGYQCQTKIKIIKTIHMEQCQDHIRARLCIYIVYLWCFKISNSHKLSWTNNCLLQTR